jgi:hypothetical protein
MTSFCWFCDKHLADPKALYRASLWAGADRVPEARPHVVQDAHRRYVRIEIPVESCLVCAHYRRRGRFGIWMGPLFGGVAVPVLYKVALERFAPGSLPVADTPYDTFMISSGIGVGIGFLGGVVLALILSRRPAGEPRPRLAQDHPEVRRMIALGWQWESPFSD